jgi:hypothetical protein
VLCQHLNPNLCPRVLVEGPCMLYTIQRNAPLCCLQLQRVARAGRYSMRGCHVCMVTLIIQPHTLVSSEGPPSLSLPSPHLCCPPGCTGRRGLCFLGWRLSLSRLTGSHGCLCRGGHTYIHTELSCLVLSQAHRGSGGVLAPTGW